MARVKNQFTAVDLRRFFEAIEVVKLHQVLELFSRSRRHLAKESQFAAKTVEAFSEELLAFFIALVGKCEAKVRSSGAPEIGGEMVSDVAQRFAQVEGCGGRQSTKT